MLQIRADSIPMRVIAGLLGVAVVLLAVVYLFNLKMVMLEFYLNMILALVVPAVYLRKRASSRQSNIIPWYDLLIALVGFGIGTYLAINAKSIYMRGWEGGAPTPALFVAGALLLILFEGTRRSFGWWISEFASSSPSSRSFRMSCPACSRDSSSL